MAKRLIQCWIRVHSILFYKANVWTKTFTCNFRFSYFSSLFKVQEHQLDLHDTIQDSVCVDDLVCGASTIEKAFKIYRTGKTVLSVLWSLVSEYLYIQIQLHRETITFWLQWVWYHLWIFHHVWHKCQVRIIHLHFINLCHIRVHVIFFCIISANNLALQIISYHPKHC